MALEERQPPGPRLDLGTRFCENGGLCAQVHSISCGAFFVLFARARARAQSARSHLSRLPCPRRTCPLPSAIENIRPACLVTSPHDRETGGRPGLRNLKEPLDLKQPGKWHEEERLCLLNS